ncbi:MAG: hypothetical protein NVS4B9_05640 [Ktedonobacteraceae bacterium]
MQELAPYELSVEVLQAITDIALTSDVLIFGELHGTQEVPRLVLSLLEALTTAGYRGLALEIPCSDREMLERWVRVQNTVLSDFFAHPLADGRGNQEVLALIQQSLTSQSDWHLLCFDQGPDQLAQKWADRDGWMAHNFTEQWIHLCPTAKIVGICGNLHSRLALPSQRGATASYWPSFAHQLQVLHPDKITSTIKIRFQSGAYFNMKPHSLHRFGWQWLFPPKKAILREARDHSFELLLPHATPATFLTPPRQWTTSSTITLQP